MCCFSNGLQNKREKGVKIENGRERERKEEFFLLRFPLFLPSFLPSFLLFSSTSFSPLSGRLLLLVVDRDGDDGGTPADHADRREAPLELAVGHLFFVWVFFFGFFSS